MSWKRRQNNNFDCMLKSIYLQIKHGKLVQLKLTNAYKCKRYEIGVNCFMRPNVMSERSPTSLNQETRDASNLYHGLC